MDFTKDTKTPFGCSFDAFGGLNFASPIGAQISVFAWNYELADIEVASIEKGSAALFNRVTVLDKKININPIRLQWRDFKAAPLSYVEENVKEFCLGETIRVYLPFSGGKVPKFKAKVQGPNNVNFLTLGEKDVKTIAEWSKPDDLKYSHKAYFDLKVTVFEELKDAKSICISSADKDTANEKLIEAFHKKTPLTLNEIGIAPGRDFLYTKSPLKLKLPILRKQTGWSSDVSSSTKSCQLHFNLTIENFKDKYIYARLWQTESWGIDDVIPYRTTKAGAYLKWNIIELKHISDNKFRYSLNSDNIQGLRDMSTDSKNFYLELAFYGHEKGDEYFTADDSALVKLDYEENGEGSVIIDNKQMKAIKL